ncbi:MAG: M42 family metallopeptidase [Armatimonadetes bacterium]|nr:M42 family metallopeptidase [Armatimonadota bacterium]
MHEQSFAFLKRLIDTPSPSGYEEPAQAVAAERLRELGAELSVDVHGNLLGTVNRGGSPRILITGHVDQIGMVVRHIGDDGLLRFEVVGGVNPHAYFAHRVDVHTKSGPVRGVVARQLPYSQEGDAAAKAMKPHEHWIDIGAVDGADARKRVRIGDPVTWVAPLERLGKQLIMGAGIDDKVCVFICLEAVAALLADKKRCSAEITVLSAVQEEVTGAGAQVAAYASQPDLAIALDVWPFTSDVPGGDANRFGELKLGQGPIICRGANCSPAVVDLLCAAAEGEKRKLPYQLCAWPGSTPTDAATIFRGREGVPTGLVGLPQRYLHTPSEAVHLDDIDHCIRLTAAAIRRLKPDMDFTRGRAILGM